MRTTAKRKKQDAYSRELLQHAYRRDDSLHNLCLSTRSPQLDKGERKHQTALQVHNKWKHHADATQPQLSLYDNLYVPMPSQIFAESTKASALKDGHHSFLSPENNNAGGSNQVAAPTSFNGAASTEYSLLQSDSINQVRVKQHLRHGSSI